MATFWYIISEPEYADSLWEVVPVNLLICDITSSTADNLLEHNGTEARDVELRDLLLQHGNR